MVLLFVMDSQPAPLPPSTLDPAASPLPAVVAEAVASPDDFAAALTHAVDLANSVGLDHDAFMRAAWHALMTGRPQLREHLEHQAMVNQIAGLRQAGKLALA
jgi:hypothetical protein